MRQRIDRVREVAVRLEAIERADRLADLIDDVHGEVAAALQELEVQADVRRLVRLPLHVGIAEGDLPEAGLDCPGTADVVEGVPAVAAELGHDAPARNLLVPGFTPTEPQHHVGEEAVLWEERLARGAPADVMLRFGWGETGNQQIPGG